MPAPVVEPSPPGVYYSLSDDLVRWSPRRLLFAAQPFDTWEPGDPAPINYPSAIDPQSESRTFGTTGRSFDVYFTRLNGAGRGGARLVRDLVRVRVELRDPGPPAAERRHAREGRPRPAAGGSACKRRRRDR